MKLFLILILTLLNWTTHANSHHVRVALTNSEQTQIGSVDFEDTTYGLLITPYLSGLPTGIHGFHIHMHPNCEDHGMNAGGHFDPDLTNTHLGPYGQGHLGDLPALTVNEKGEATLPLLAPRLKTKDLSGHALMIHAGGDTYKDVPTLGGGGARLACGVIPN
jgi:Cu-Zn family superoxide dismutase